MNKKSIRQNNLRNFVITGISQSTENRLYENNSFEWKASVSSMTSAKEGQPPFNEPEEWHETHPLSPLKWATLQATLHKLPKIAIGC